MAEMIVAGGTLSTGLVIPAPSLPHNLSTNQPPSARHLEETASRPACGLGIICASQNASPQHVRKTGHNAAHYVEKLQDLIISLEKPFTFLTVDNHLNFAIFPFRVGGKITRKRYQLTS